MKHDCPDSSVTRECVHHSSINLSPVIVKKNISDKIELIHHHMFSFMLMYYGFFLRKRICRTFLYLVFNFLSICNLTFMLDKVATERSWARYLVTQRTFTNNWFFCNAITLRILFLKNGVLILEC